MNVPIDNLKAQYEKLLKDHEALQEEFKKLQKQSADHDWGIQKTNESIKILYKELEKKNKELQKLDQLKSDFVSTVSHELRTPLAITTEGLSLVLDGVLGPLTEKQKKILTTGKRNIERLHTIINDLLDISKIEAGKIEIKSGFIDFRKILINHLESFQSVVNAKKITLQSSLPKAAVYLYIDEDKIIQVMNNLLNNAVKFTPEGGGIMVGMTVNRDEVLVSVKDTGVGINEEDMTRLFEKFQQFSRAPGPGIKGTGLGLAICKSLVELHGGQIWAESRVGKGTTFFFTLPCYEKLRARFSDQFNDILESARTVNKSVSLLAIKLEELHKNDVPDEEQLAMFVTNEMLRLLRKVVTGPQDKIFLYQRETIFVVLPETNKAGAGAVANRIRQAAVKQDFHYQQQDIHATFHIGLAVFPWNAIDQEELIKMALADVGRIRNIAVLSQTEAIHTSLHSELSSKNFMVRSIKSSEEFVRFLDSGKPMHEQLPDLIVLDMSMPGVNGYEIYGRIKGTPHAMHVPVVLLASGDINWKEAQLNGLDASLVIEKEEGHDKLVELIRRLV